jgi:hypothetical protein
MALLALAAYVVDSWEGLPAAIAMTSAFVIASTTCGQALAWWVMAWRQTRTGRRAVWTMVVVAAVVAAVAVYVGPTEVLDRSPTRGVVIATLQGAAGAYGRWAWTLVALAAVTAAGLAAGTRATSYTTRLPPSVAADHRTRSLPRRPPPTGTGAQLRAIDRASVWRAPSLRRGVIVMAALPGAAAAIARVDWATLALTGGLVTAGAGLLFAVNAFCLDGGGSLWGASLPLDPRTHLRAKTWVTSEVCLGCGLIAVVAGASRSPESASFVAVITALSTVLACGSVVVASCLRSSVARPHRADLRGPRDTPAPPGAMAAHSARLAAVTTLVALFVTGLGQTGTAAAPLLGTVAVVALAARSLVKTARTYAEPSHRSRVAVTVAVG